MMTHHQFENPPEQFEGRIIEPFENLLSPKNCLDLYFSKIRCLCGDYLSEHSSVEQQSVFHQFPQEIQGNSE